MKYAIEVLEEDILDVVIGLRNTADIKIALKILKEAVENSKLLKL